MPHPRAIITLLTLSWIGSLTPDTHADDQTRRLIAEDAKVVQVADGFRFTEGPAVNRDGDVYFTDIPNQRIHKWDHMTGLVTVFMNHTGGINGLYFAANGDLYGCQGEERKVVAIGPDAKIKKVLAEHYQGKKLNKPNDLWITPAGGVYFTDPAYVKDKSILEQDGEHVYFIPAGGGEIKRVADDFERPNGIIGSADGKKLYITDRNGDTTYVYGMKSDGTLTDKTLFCKEGADGMTLDQHGNLYLTPKAKGIHIYNPQGQLIGRIALPANPSNVTFGGKDRKTLFITARTGFYQIKMQVAGQ